MLYGPAADEGVVLRLFWYSKGGLELLDKLLSFLLLSLEQFQFKVMGHSSQTDTQRGKRAPAATSAAPGLVHGQKHTRGFESSAVGNNCGAGSVAAPISPLRTGYVSTQACKRLQPTPRLVTTER